MSLYNPYQHADQLGVTVTWADLPQNIQGQYDHRNHTITLNRLLTSRQANCVLAHEIQHAIYRDNMNGIPEEWEDRIERACDAAAAKNLVVWPQLVDAMKESPDPRYWCLELVLMPWVLKSFFENLTPQEINLLEKESGQTVSTDLIFALEN